MKPKIVVIIAAFAMIIIVLSFLIAAYSSPTRITRFEATSYTIREGDTVTIHVEAEAFLMKSVTVHIVNPEGSRSVLKLERVGDRYVGNWRAPSPGTYRIEATVTSLTSSDTKVIYVKVTESLGSQLIAVMIDSGDQQSSWERSENFFPVYIKEILRHAGIPFEIISKANLSSLSSYRILILPYNTSLTSSEKDEIRDFVAAGGSLIAIGGSSGLNEIFGVGRVERVLNEGYIEITDTDHLITSNLSSSLHVVGKIPLYPLSRGEVLAKVKDTSGNTLDYPAVVLNRYGEGLAILIAPDLVSSVVNIQQGKPVIEDGPWPVNDNILKTDDGILLSYETDRDPVFKHMVFLKPIADEEKEIIIKALLYACWEKGTPLPILWYWPGDIRAVALYSHDSDGGDEFKARCLLSNMTALGVKSTWCILLGEGYSKEFYSMLKRNGYEIALHYDALRRPWSEEEFSRQYDAVSSETGVSLVSDKNHYLRWEHWTEFYRWCEKKGIEADQTKGPTKVHNFGFLYGTCHPYFPIDDWRYRNRFLNVLEIPLHDQEMWRGWPEKESIAVLNNFTYQAYMHYGVIHHLFHPAHIQRVHRVLNATIQYIKSLPNMSFWTSKQINDWERARRSVFFKSIKLASRELSFQASSRIRVNEATIIVLVPRNFNPEEWSIRVGGSEVKWETTQIYGFTFAKFTIDIEGLISIDVQTQAAK